MRRLKVIGVAAAVLLLAGCGSGAATPHHKRSPFASFCVNGLTHIAPGPGGSFYIEDQTGILHISASRHLLQRTTPAGGPMVTSSGGDLYYVHGSQISELSPSGARLRTWPSGGMFPLAIGAHRDLLVSDDGVELGNPTSRIEWIDGRDQVIRRWRTPNAYAMAFAADGSLFAVGGVSAGIGALYRLDARTGRVITAFGKAADLGVTTTDLVTASPNGHVYVGVETGAAKPFAIQALSARGGRYSFTTLNRANELVGELAVDDNGTMLVVRSSYARSGNVGLDELSARGHVEGTFPNCRHGNH